MKADSLPLVRASSVLGRSKTTFHTLNQEIVVEAPQNLVRDIIRLCDGTRQYVEIVSRLEALWDADVLDAFLTNLNEIGVLVDACALSDEVWSSVENPSRFPTGITEDRIAQIVEIARDRHGVGAPAFHYEPTDGTCVQLIKHRRSVRSFSGETVSSQSIANILWSAYGSFVSDEDGVLRVTSPSAGALYPLVVDLVLFKETGDLPIGIYRACYDTPGRVGFEPSSRDVNRVRRSFLDPMVLSGAHGLIVVSGCIPFSSEKYGNRGMLYTILEAGHVAQNILLAAVDCRVATLEVGGFIDQLLAQSCELQELYRPLTTVVFGVEGDSLQTAHGPQIEWAVPMHNSFRPPFTIASVRVSERRSWSHGRDPDPSIALIKATAEAREWAACGSVPQLVEARYQELDTAVDPRSIIMFHQSQYKVKGFPFAPFDESAKHEWTMGYDYATGSRVHILADQVYFPFYPKNPDFCFANSSGCAAHVSESKAVETAVLELIERDSFMIAYLGAISLPNVALGSLPRVIQERITAIESEGFLVWVKDYTLDLAPVIMVFAQSDTLAYTTCAACSSFDLEYAVSHALMEVEASVLSRLHNGSPGPISPCEVGMPLDHGRLYGQKLYYRRANFLVESGEELVFADVSRDAAHSWAELLGILSERELRLLVVPLELSSEFGGNSGLHIVRAIIPGLVPMTFGYRQEPAGMGRIYAIAREFDRKELSYKDLVKFPHPFE